ncbi:MAG: hypothetical protein LIO51_09135 [Clostridiales bacterium]|nr:hypothetical protein [Clostridiales bacterium]
MAKRKEIKLADMLGGLTPEQRKSFAEQYNGGLGSGLTPEQYRAKYYGDKAGQDADPDKGPDKDHK